MPPFFMDCLGRERDILLSLGKRPRSVVQFTNFFFERVDKPTDTKHLALLLPPRLTLIRAPNGSNQSYWLPRVISAGVGASRRFYESSGSALKSDAITTSGVKT